MADAQRANRAQRRAALKDARRAERRDEWGPWEEVPVSAAMRAAYRVAPRRAFRNAVYSVQAVPRHTVWGEVLLLMVRRHDAQPIRSWPVLQRVKNTLPVAGPERVAIEVYPRESELVDDANMYHLWLLPEGFDLPFGLS